MPKLADAEARCSIRLMEVRRSSRTNSRDFIWCCAWSRYGLLAWTRLVQPTFGTHRRGHCRRVGLLASGFSVALMSSPRRFPAPWSAEVQPNYYVVRDPDGQQLAYVYYSNDPDRRSVAKLLMKDEARRIA